MKHSYCSVICQLTFPGEGTCSPSKYTPFAKLSFFKHPGVLSDPDVAQVKKTFLSSPIWRDFVFGCVLVSLGFMLSSPSGPLFGWTGLLLMGIGGAVLLAATINALWSAMRLSENGTQKRPQ